MSSKVEDLTKDELVLYKKGKREIRDIIAELKASDFNKDDQNILISELDFDVLRPMLLYSSKMKDLTMELLIHDQFLEVVKEKFERRSPNSEHWSSNTYSLLRLLRNVLYWGSEHFGKVFLELGLPEILVSDLSDHKLTNLNSQEIGERVFELLCCCYNVMKINPDSRLEFRKHGLVKLCTHYMQKAGNDRKLINELLFVLSYVADLDADPEALEATNSNLHYIHERLKLALQNDDHRSEIGFSAAEILACISRLVLTSDNSLFMLEHGIITTCESVINAEFKDDEVILALETLWTLSFQSKGARDINTNKTLCEMIKSNKSSDNKQISEVSTGILFQLDIDQEVSKRAVNFIRQTSDGSQQDSGQHILISYSSKQSEVAGELTDLLRDSDGGRRVWLDIEKMEGNMLERMAEGVEGASVVVCCYSESYKNSQACRSEAEYAFKLNKHIIYVKTQQDYSPNGWLGIMMGNDLYYEMTDIASLHKKLPDVIAGINKLSTAPPPNRTSKIRQITNFEFWNCDEVVDWIKSMSLKMDIEANIRDNGVAGSTLDELLHWQNAIPKFFLRFCEATLGLHDPMDILVFSQELRKLK